MSFDRREWTLHDPRAARAFDPPPRPYPWHEHLRTELISVTGIVWLVIVYTLYVAYQEHDLWNGAIGVALATFFCVQPFRMRRVLRDGDLVAVTVRASDLGSLFFWLAHVKIGETSVKVPLPPSVRELARRNGSVDILVLTPKDRPGLTFFIASRSQLRT